MSSAVFASCAWVLFCAADERQSGRPTSDRCSGLVDCILYLHEEYYVRVGELFGGYVVAITDDTITIKKWRQVPRVFRVSPTLVSDRIPLPQRLGTGHRLSQVRIGDAVGFDLAHAADGHVCIALGICRRPGGRVPEAEDQHLPQRSRLHVRCNIEQFFEETFLPKWLPRLVTYHAP